MGGGGLIQDKNHTTFEIFSSIYPKHKWLPWRFNTFPLRVWDDPMVRKRFVFWAEKQLDIKEESDWYNVTMNVNKN